LRSGGKEVPRDVALTSFNVVEYDECADAGYSVSGINVPREAAGRAAVEFLTEIVNGDYTRKPFIKELELSLIKRRSCGCA
jgi:DNA-binding LacI/PurR family transcriptional regulator